MAGPTLKQPNLFRSPGGRKGWRSTFRPSGGPGVEHFDTGIGEVSGVASRERATGRQTDRGDLGVKRTDRPTRAFASRDQCPVLECRRVAERENLPSEPPEDVLSRNRELIAAAPCWQTADGVVDLGDADRGGVELRVRLLFKPTKYQTVRLGAHQLRQDGRVKNDQG